MKLLFVVNPISGGINKEPFMNKAKDLCNKFGIDYAVFKTTGVNDLEKLKEKLSLELPDKVVSVGGDGTTLFTSVALLSTPYPMGIVPLGSANGMAVELFVDPDPMEALKDIIMTQIVASLDLLLINDEHYSIHIGDVGVNARIVEAYSKDKNRGMITYAKYFLDELTRLQPIKFTLKANGKTINDEGFMLGICNGRKYGTGVPLNLDGNPMDGMFELVIVEKINTATLLKAGLSKFNEKFYDAQSGKVIQTTEAKITFDKPRLLQLDGEVTGKFKELHIRILPGAVQLLTNKKNIYVNEKNSRPFSSNRKTG